MFPIMIRCKIFFLISLISFCYSESMTSISTLQQVHVIFRHGDRTPDKVSMYPKDPYLNDTWYPDGLGALTNYGKMQMFFVGKELRAKYDKYLGKIYSPDIIDAWTTDYDRTKMSLELVLAGLWPPAPSQIWNPLLNWQPIPYNYKPTKQDNLLNFPLVYCPIYQSEYSKVTADKPFKSFLETNANLIQYINENSGLKAQTIMDLFILYFGLYAEEHTGRILPVWTKTIYPHFLEEAAKLAYVAQTYNDVLLKYSGGRMIKAIIDNAISKMQGTLVPASRKMFLFSGHEYNIAHVLAALKLYKPHIPKYASYILIELHKIKDVYGFKIFYQDYSCNGPVVLTMPGCESFCPIESFMNLTNDIIPLNNCI